MTDKDNRKKQLGADGGRSIIRSSGSARSMVQQNRNNGAPDIRKSGKGHSGKSRSDIRLQNGNGTVTGSRNTAGNRIVTGSRNPAGNGTVSGRKQKMDYQRVKLGISQTAVVGKRAVSPQIRTASFTCRGQQADPAAIRGQIRRESAKKQMTMKEEKSVARKKKQLHISSGSQTQGGSGYVRKTEGKKAVIQQMSGQNPVTASQISRIKEVLHVSSGQDQGERVRAAMSRDAVQKEDTMRAELAAGKDPGRLKARDITYVLTGYVSGKKRAERKEGKKQDTYGKHGQGRTGVQDRHTVLSARKKRQIKAYAITRLVAKKAAVKAGESSEKETRQAVRTATDLYHMVQAVVSFILHIGTAAIVLAGLLIAMAVVFLLSAVMVVSSASGSPQAYFEQAYADEVSLVSHQKYIDSALQEKYNALSNEVADFLGTSPYNQVVYSSGITYNWNSVLAVYFSLLYTSDGYDGCYNTRDAVAKEFPQYFLVDTDKEKDLLKDIFCQMNYTVTEDIQVSVPAQDGTATTVLAQKMTVFSLSVDQWTAVYGSNLSEEAKELLELLKEYENQYAAGGGGTAGGGEYTPLEGITIPEGANANLIYMAGFLEAEAGGQPEEGQRAVAYVMLNRAGGNVNGVIPALLAPSAFSCYIPYHTVEAKIQKYAAMTEEQRNADPIYSVCAAAASGTSANPIGTWRYYCNPNGCAGGATTQWAKIRAKNSEAEYRQIGDHVFCANGWW